MGGVELSVQINRTLYVLLIMSNVFPICNMADKSQQEIHADKWGANN